MILHGHLRACMSFFRPDVSPGMPIRGVATGGGGAAGAWSPLLFKSGGLPPHSPELFNVEYRFSIFCKVF